jgi:hypothetical protein
MREDTALADHPRSYPAHHPTVRVDDTDTWLLAAAARELEAHLSFERARQVADARALLAALYEGDGVAVEDAVLDAQAEDVARLERADRFLHELAAQLQPDAEVLEAAAALDDHMLLGSWWWRRGFATRTGETRTRCSRP